MGSDFSGNEPVGNNCVLHSQTLSRSRSLRFSCETGHFILFLGNFSQWLELPAVQLHTCRKWTTPNQPSWGFLVLGLGLALLSAMESWGGWGSAGNKKLTLLSLIAAQSQALSSGPALPLPELRFLQCNAFQILSAKCFEKDKNRAVIAPGSWGDMGF